MSTLHELAVQLCTCTRGMPGSRGSTTSHAIPWYERAHGTGHLRLSGRRAVSALTSVARAHAPARGRVCVPGPSIGGGAGGGVTGGAGGEGGGAGGGGEAVMA